ncbi:hypothetical protein [Neobacillus mesonae]|uniref:hypothetical protein n=1 Tax=Neobacillus mesonae TaxID=1193713 RepID=UPI00203FB6D5|nr:hypothetical protein [Neobacillus mesonae]MCM3567641.1 hypothetical protein [Neobacillus mesonae]
MSFLKLSSKDLKIAQAAFRKKSKSKRLIIAALFACIASIFQSAGGFLPGIGYFISPFSTAPILLCSIFSVPLGFFTYLLTNLLLLFLEPSELIVFPFTTGILGLGIGTACSFFKQKILVVGLGAFFLTAGILILLYGIKFPVLGPVVQGSYSILTAGLVFGFACIYAWIWVDFGLFLFNKIKRLFLN